MSETEEMEQEYLDSDITEDESYIIEQKSEIKEIENIQRKNELEKAEDLTVCTQKDVVNMFASVWVKEEVPDKVSEDETVSQDRSLEAKTPKKHKRKTKVLNCDICDYTTAHKNCLNLHMMGHNSQKPYSCEKCDYATKYPTALNRHVMIKHSDEDTEDKKGIPTYNCDECDYKSYFKWNLHAHKRKHNVEKQYKCQQCEYKTAYRHNFIKHSKTHKEGTIYQCDKCPFVTRFDGHITRHLAKIHNIITDIAFKCDLCDFSTRVRWRLNVHKQRSRQRGPMKCGYCEFTTEYSCQFKKHKTGHYNQMCSKVFVNDDGKEEIYDNKDLSNEEGKQDTIQQQTDRLEVQNNDSDELQSQKYLLDPNCIDWNSIQVLESEDKDRPFQCHMCTYTSRFKASVQRHFQRHHTGDKNRPYKCINCDFSTKTKDQIALHNKRSQSDMKLYCSLCNFETNYKCQYVMHQKCHYSHKCPKCSYSCKHKYELQKHFTTVHLGNGHKCKFCDYTASRKESLLCHETIHTGNKPFHCDFCAYTSVRRSLLNNHMKRYHGDLMSDVTVITVSKIEALKKTDSDVANKSFELE